MRIKCAMFYCIVCACSDSRCSCWTFWSTLWCIILICLPVCIHVYMRCFAMTHAYACTSKTLAAQKSSLWISCMLHTSFSHICSASAKYRIYVYTCILYVGNTLCMCMHAGIRYLYTEVLSPLSIRPTHLLRYFYCTERRVYALHRGIMSICICICVCLKTL